MRQTCQKALLPLTTALRWFCRHSGFLEATYHKNDHEGSYYLKTDQRKVSLHTHSCLLTPSGTMVSSIYFRLFNKESFQKCTYFQVRIISLKQGKNSSSVFFPLRFFSHKEIQICFYISPTALKLYLDFRWEYSLNTINSQQNGGKPSFIISLDGGKITEKLLLFGCFL